MTDFIPRHIGPTGDELSELLSALGVADLDELIDAAVPSSILTEDWSAGIPDADSPAGVIARLQRYADKNIVNTSLIGQGYYNTRTPAVIQRNVLENPAWYTAYTPYQPEISQGRLEALINFQTMVSELTGTDVAGASMLDEGTAVAEAIALARRATRKGSKVLLDADIFDTTRDVVMTRTNATDVTVELSDLEPGVDLYDVFAVVIQYPGASGRVRPAEDVRALASAAHGAGALVIIVQDLLAATVLPSAGSLGADIAAGSTQRFGVPMGFGGPHAGYLSVTEKLQRQLPGRLVGVSKDADGQPAYRLALQTREQHIRREKATSSICTAQVLLAVMASMYAVWHGPTGLQNLAKDVHDKAVSLARGLADVGVSVRHADFFDTIELDLGDRADEAVSALYDKGILVFTSDDGHLRVSTDELTNQATIDEVVQTLAEFGSGDGAASEFGLGVSDVRAIDYMTHPVFNSHHTETKLMRYLRRLSDKDYALDRGMIPLGSCTMKLNSAVEMAAITWPKFAALHPLCPESDSVGYRELIAELTSWLTAITGYDCGSLQPNSGAQGEFAGLLAIRGYHDSRGDTDRRICLIPASAHGTNAASAALAGMQVVVVACDENGNVDVEDLKAKCDKHADRLGAIMITYPSTHGVYEAAVQEICQIVHDAGGQVYIDGANLNALVAVARPGKFGGDVSHLNLHKTFAIPHGGGGPGVGPVLAREHLKPFLPGHRVLENKERAVSSAPYGSASILPIPWAYLALLGADGLRQATATAVASANYVAKRLDPYFPVLYKGQNDLVAHECILDLRPLKKDTGITVDDVAKRLMDYGFHAPTMSFPVAGTLMVEPTESEDLGEIDRFCEAMILIHEEAMEVKNGTWPKDDNPLVNAPHTAQCALVGEWEHPYSREIAVYAGAYSVSNRGEDPVAYANAVASKYWPPVRRIDGAWGDRNLTCSCPPIEAYEDSE